MSSSLQSLIYQRGNLSVIDQLKLPHELVYIEVNSSEDAWVAIRTMQVRGAPLIAIVAALALAVHVCKVRATFKSSSDAAEFLSEKMTYLRTSRPTAVNLFVATDELLATVLELQKKGGSTADSVVDGFLEEAEVSVLMNKFLRDTAQATGLDISVSAFLLSLCCYFVWRL
jgi:methylthioribose-1-phosphate isomerase